MIRLLSDAVASGDDRRPRPAWQALAALAATACALGGATAVIVAVAAGPTPVLTGYVSEAGVTTSGSALPYRTGVFGLAAALLLLSVALPAPPRIVTALLVVAAGNTVVSGAVSCSEGCPLPPFEAATVADLVHGGASVLAVACCVFAMLALACSPTVDTSVRRLAVTALSGALPLSGAVGVAMLAVGRGTVVGVLERLLLALIVLWVAATAVRLAAGTTRGRATRRPSARHVDRAPDDR